MGTVLFPENQNHSLSRPRDLTAPKSHRPLDLDHNKLTGGLKPLRGCTALDLLYLDDNKLTGGLEPLRGCTALHILQSTSRESNNLAGGLEPLRGCSALEGSSSVTTNWSPRTKTLKGPMLGPRSFDKSETIFQ